MLTIVIILCSLTVTTVCLSIAGYLLDGARPSLQKYWEGGHCPPCSYVLLWLASYPGSLIIAAEEKRAWFQSLAHALNYLWLCNNY